MTVDGLLLAAGAGSRMGRPKALVRGDDGEPWMVRSVRALTDGGCAQVTVVLGASAETLAQQTVAFDGTVTTLADGAVTLSVGHWYAGGPTDLVRVQAPEEELQELVGAVKFKQGGRYLVSATDGQVTVCGFSAPYSADLAALYDQAFG